MDEQSQEEKAREEKANNFITTFFRDRDEPNMGEIYEKLERDYTGKKKVIYMILYKHFFLTQYNTPVSFVYLQKKVKTHNMDITRFLGLLIANGLAQKMRIRTSNPDKTKKIWHILLTPSPYHRKIYDFITDRI